MNTPREFHPGRSPHHGVQLSTHASSEPQIRVATLEFFPSPPSKPFSSSLGIFEREKPSCFRAGLFISVGVNHWSNNLRLLCTEHTGHIQHHNRYILVVHHISAYCAPSVKPVQPSKYAAYHQYTVRTERKITCFCPNGKKMQCIEGKGIKSKGNYLSANSHLACVNGAFLGCPAAEVVA